MDNGRSTVDSARRDALAFAAAGLTRAAVPFFAFRGYTGDPPRIGVLESRRRAAEDALRAAATDDWRARPRPAGKTAVDVPLGELPETSGTRAWTIYRPRSWDQAWFRLGPEAGIAVEFWRETERGWEAPTRNPVAGVVTPAGQEPVTLEIGGTAYPSCRAFDVLPWDDVAGAVDVVYTWVDGADPQWRQQRAARLADAGGMAAVRPESRDEHRFTDHGELRYSLRSIEQFLPWVRTVHLVTADQRPDWLVTDHPRLRLVSHRDILDAEALPTFNSLAIETGLHRIDGLADRFLYFNDDVFAGRPLRALDFFAGNGVSKFFPQVLPSLDPTPWSAADDPVTGIEKRVRDLLEARFGRRVSTLLSHTPHPLQRAVLADLEREFPAEIESTRRSPFRRGDNVSMTASLHHFFAYFTGRAIPASLRYRGVRLGGEDLRERLRAVGRLRPEAFCLNDTSDDDLPAARKARIVARFLDRYLPEPSSFER